ncbi:MAG TPA: MMPL family transporter [Solirubrobacterales bacterium]|nr:MMPL family transporter [Solirubrobacterales bacterium]
MAIAALVLAVLGVIGTGVESKLDPTTLDVPGTGSFEGNALLREHFGDSAPFAILLQGPAASIDRQGPKLVRALRRDPNVSTLSPWDRGNVSQLRPGPNRALILADFHVDVKEAVNEVVPRLNALLAREVHPPVRATQTAYASISRALQDVSISASERGELLALPFLLIVLLLVFRSPIAAAIPLAFGAVTVVASRGILYFLTNWFDIDAFALTVCTMMGLALGVDYALLMVSRFREELALGTEKVEAARITRRTAGRTTAFAGSTLLLSMVVAMFIVPGPLLASLAGTVVMVVILSVIVATLVGPALLSLIGSNVDRWRIGSAPVEGDSRLMRLVGAALRRPALVAAVIGVVILVLSAPALALKTGPPSPEQLSRDNPAREDAELIAEQVAPGFEAPFQVVVADSEGPITDAKDLATLTKFQERVAEIPGVQVVIGPAQVAAQTEPLRERGNALFASGGEIAPVKQLGRLGRSLKVAAGGVSQLRSGIAEASDGAGLLAVGSDRAGTGAEKIANGLARAASGSKQAVGALDRFEKGAKELSHAQERAALGGLQLKLAARDLGGANFQVNLINRSLKVEKSLEEETGETLPRILAPAKVAEEQLKAAFAQLQGMGVGKTDPNYPAALEAVRRATAAVTGTDPVGGAPYAPNYTGLPAELEALQANLLEDLDNTQHVTDWLESTLIHLEELSAAAEKLSDGLYEISAGGKKLAAGSTKLAEETAKLVSGLSRLSAGTVALVGGIDRLSGGAEALEAGLEEAVDRASPLQSGLNRASVQVLSGKKQVKQQVKQISDASPNLFNSGYFVLATVDGAQPDAREAASQAIDLESGQAATIRVFSKYSFNTPGSIRLNKTLNQDARELGQETGLVTGVAGGAAQVNDFTRVTKDRFPLVVIAVTLVTLLVLIAVLRAIPLAIIAVGLNLVTVGVAFGVLTLLTYLPDGVPLGGRSYVEAIGATMIFGLVFGLSIDYAVFLLSRMREHYDDHGDNAAAIQFGLDKTARVITGAAAIMMAVFIAFAGAPAATVSQLGVGLTVAVILDATVVRIVLLPALMLLVGDRVWWLPRWLDRALPKLRV